MDSAYLLVGVFFMFNFLTFLLVLETLTELKIFKFFIEYKLTFAISFLVMVEILGYFFVRRNKAYLKIIKEFKKESVAERKKYSTLAIIYFVATFLFVILSTMVWGLTNKT